MPIEGLLKVACLTPGGKAALSGSGETHQKGGGVVAAGFFALWAKTRVDSRKNGAI